MNKMLREKLKQKVKEIYFYRHEKLNEKSESVVLDLAKRYNVNRATIYRWLAS